MLNLFKKSTGSVKANVQQAEVAIVKATVKHNGVGRNGSGPRDGETIRVGRSQADITASSHTPGVKRANAPGNFDKESGLHAHKDGARATARRSTGINPDARNPIDPRMPNLPPA